MEKFGISKHIVLLKSKLPAGGREFGLRLTGLHLCPLIHSKWIATFTALNAVAFLGQNVIEIMTIFFFCDCFAKQIICLQQSFFSKSKLICKNQHGRTKVADCHNNFILVWMITCVDYIIFLFDYSIQYMK